MDFFLLDTQKSTRLTMTSWVYPNYNHLIMHAMVALDRLRRSLQVTLTHPPTYLKHLTFTLPTHDESTLTPTHFLIFITGFYFYQCTGPTTTPLTATQMSNRGEDRAAGLPHLTALEQHLRPMKKKAAPLGPPYHSGLFSPLQTPSEEPTS